ncbi:MAG: bile acid:sodium symporter [Candidatus Cybelea sp.]|jgi:BASS family bile acid:Na+ symporter
MNPVKLTAVIMLVALTFGAGSQVNRTHLVAAFKNVNLLVWALIANFIVIPALGVLLAKLFALPPFVATGFLLMAIAPGVPLVLASVRKRGGSLGFAVALELLLPLLSIITVPLTAALVLPAAAGEIPVSQFVKTLVLFQLVPLLAGIVVGYRAPTLAQKLARPLQFVFFIAAIALIVLVFPKLVVSVSTVYGSHGMLAMLCLVLLSLAVGWTFGGPARENRRVLAIGSTLRNIGLCTLIATTNFREVQVVASVMCYFIVQFVCVTLTGIYFTRTADKAAV